ncbi:MAG TPA: hypothetical protein VG796_00120 [Verrucomicrobiales bacterium]|nr:hypothetical protein [Verrucomicrobiales bacterium]
MKFAACFLCLLGCLRVWGQTPALCPGSWTMVHIPDTQNYVSDAVRTEIANGQMNWIRDNRGRMDIRMAVQVGDLVNDNLTIQWVRVRSAFDRLTGVVPYALSSGNHDCGPGGNGNTRATMFSEDAYFGPGSPYAGQGTAGGFFQHPDDAPGNTQNAWHTFRAGRQDFLILTCEWGPRNKVVEWMGSVVAAHPFHRAILVCHAYMDTGAARLDWALSRTSMNPHYFGIAADPDGVNDGQDLWEKLVKRYENFCLVCCGHAGRGFRTVTGINGNKVHEMLFNTQEMVNGGDGWMRLLEFLPDGRTVRARTWSSYKNLWDDTAAGNFEFTLSPVSSTDTDGDGLPDYYEAQHGWRLEYAGNATADSDHDGVSNLEEFRAGTSPLDASSCLRIRSVSAGAQEVTLEWESVPGVRYQIQECAALSGAPWENAGAVMTAASLTTRKTVPCSEARRFFRIAATTGL